MTDDASMDAETGEQDANAGEERREKPHKAPLPLWQETLLLLGIALVLAIGIKFFFVQAFYIPSPSMEPQFIENDRILVQKVSYWGGGHPERGDIVVFKDPGTWLGSDESNHSSNPLIRGLELVGLYPSGGHLVKRIIGVGGDRVVCCDKQGRVTVNGVPLDEKAYLPKGTLPSEDPFDVTVPEGHLWVMGDNRDDSCDSRCHTSDPSRGFVADDLVVGKVWALIWPWGRAEFIHRPATFEKIPGSS